MNGSRYILLGLLMLEITYSDNGKGLTDAGYDKFFEPFYTTNRSKGGSSLGTHIA